MEVRSGVAGCVARRFSDVEGTPDRALSPGIARAGLLLCAVKTRGEWSRCIATSEIKHGEACTEYLVLCETYCKHTYSQSYTNTHQSWVDVHSLAFLILSSTFNAVHSKTYPLIDAV